MATPSIRKGFPWGRVRVAGLLVVALLLLAFAVYKAGDVFDVFADRYELVTLLPNAAGLREGGAVGVAGQRVGSIEEISFIPLERQRDGQHLRVRISLAEDVREQVRADSRAIVRMQGFLGDKYLDISPGTAGSPVLMPGDTLLSQPPVDLDAVLTRATGMLDEAEVVMQNLQTLTAALAGGEGAIGRLLTDDALYERVMVTTTELARTLHEINVSEGTIGRLLRDPALYERMEGALAQVEQLTTDLADGDGTLGRLAGSDSLYNALTGTVQRADSVLASLESAADMVTDGDGAVARLLRDPAMYDEMLQTIEELQTLLEDIRADPTRYRPEVQVDVL